MTLFERPVQHVFNARVGEVLPEPTPLERAVELSERLGHSIWLKREDLTPVFSFKLRGAYNAIANMPQEQRARGILAASAGNHAQGVAFAGRRLGCPTRIVMPQTTPSIKVSAVKRLGAQVDLHGDSFSDAAELALELERATGMTLIHPFDDPDVIAGQGTVGLEVLRQAPRDLSAIFVPIGGGGLAAGVAAVVKELRPEVRVIGVEPEDSDAMCRAFAAGRPVTLPAVGIFADGVAVRRVGDLTYALCKRYLDDITRVTTDEICGAIEDGFLDTRSILEPAGALSLAGAKRYHRAVGLPPGQVVVVASGANMSFTRLGYVAERAELGRQREALLAVTIPERPGAFLEFCLALGRRSVTEFNYRLTGRDKARVFVGVEVSVEAEGRQIIQDLTRAGFECADLSSDDLAKTHIRHMVGGVSALARDEVLYCFEFPERPGALAEFLESLGNRWNISLFHYRNHGAAFGRVLCGMEVTPAERPLLEARLARLGFAYSTVVPSPATTFIGYAEGGTPSRE